MTLRYFFRTIEKKVQVSGTAGTVPVPNNFLFVFAGSSELAGQADSLCAADCYEALHQPAHQQAQRSLGGPLRLVGTDENKCHIQCCGAGPFLPAPGFFLPAPAPTPAPPPIKSRLSTINFLLTTSFLTR